MDSGGAKVLTLRRTSGPVLISADLHGNLEDFQRLRELFLASHARGEDPTWIGVGDWIHGPAGDTSYLLDEEGRPLYDYPDDSAALLAALFSLMDAHPGRVISLLGNHEHAHIGGPRTRKFHPDEAAHLEAQLAPAQVAELRRRLRAFPLLARLPSCGVVVTHGAMSGPLGSAAELERVRYDGEQDEAATALLRSAMTHYGYSDGGDLRLLAALSESGEAPYRLLVHGHDREETGHARTGERALLLCSSFGARRARKTYLWLDLARRYQDLDELREGEELRLLYGP